VDFHLVEKDYEENADKHGIDREAHGCGVFLFGLRHAGNETNAAQVVYGKFVNEDEVMTGADGVVALVPLPMARRSLAGAFYRLLGSILI
jgi:hypothetical protein